jgi:hypothetical protein
MYEEVIALEETFMFLGRLQAWLKIIHNSK